MEKQPLVLAILLFFNTFIVNAQLRDPNRVKALSSSAFNKSKTNQAGTTYNHSQVNQNGAVEIYAVVVGIGNYFTMPQLQFTDDDAAIFYDHLKSAEGGSVPDDHLVLLLNEDATRQNIVQSLQVMSRQADENDVFIFYFSGHGINGAFLPVDFDGVRNQLRHDEILQILESGHARQKLCIADACFSGTLDYDNTFAAKSPYASPTDCYYDAFEHTQTGTALLMSSNPGEVSLEDRKLRHGVFTYFLMRGMKGAADFNHNQIVTIQELYQYVYHYVAEYTEGVQTPVLTGDYDNSLPVAFARTMK